MGLKHFRAEGPPATRTNRSVTRLVKEVTCRVSQAGSPSKGRVGSFEDRNWDFDGGKRMKKPAREREVIVQRYERYIERRIYEGPWRAIVGALGGFWVGVGATRLWFLLQ